MFKVLSNDLIAPEVHRMVIEASRVAKVRQPGQFVIVRHCEKDERIPLTIADADPAAGTITLIIQAVGVGTKDITATPAGGALRDVAGPLGRPTEIERWGRAACVGGGVGTAVLYPLAKALADAGNEITTIIGARSKGLVILREELAAFSKDVLITTEDGSEGVKGFVTAALEPLVCDPRRRPNVVFAVGPVPMMAAVAEMTRPHGIKTVVSLNPIMVDGTGMCGGCRVTVGGKVRFACVDGPEFDAHEVNFKELADRQGMYGEERCKLEGQLESMAGGGE
ncbi:MAG TPA: sulfide/dihydroorotate dehydrogenase-like FAD/NAD-binding protein [Phycisphaerae bacterium]|nr:sulfide/dihydroorotate dehydrogenase-like FAD/NAD-binding protein [Phycisphaerae bacterium]